MCQCAGTTEEIGSIWTTATGLPSEGPPPLKDLPSKAEATTEPEPKLPVWVPWALLALALLRDA